MEGGWKRELWEGLRRCLVYKDGIQLGSKERS